jgi:hypothetical protein
MRFDLTEEIVDAKRKLGYKLLIPPARLQIVNNGKILRDTIHMADFANGNPLILHIRNSAPTMLHSAEGLKIAPEINIRILRQFLPELTLTVSANLTVGEVKEVIAEKVGMPDDQFGLVYESHFLNDGESLQAAQVGNGGILLVLSKVGLPGASEDGDLWEEMLFEGITPEEVDELMMLQSGIRDLDLIVMFIRAGRDIERLQRMLAESNSRDP